MPRCEEPGLRALQLHPYLIALLPFCLWTWDQGPWDPWTVCPDLVLLQAWWSLGTAQLSSTSSCPEMLLLLAPFQGQGGAVPREAQGHLCGLRPAGVLVYMYLSEAGPPPPSLGHSQLSGAGGVTLSSSGLIPALFSRTTLTCCSGQALGAFLCLSLCSQERADKLIHSQVEVTIIPSNGFLPERLLFHGTICSVGGIIPVPAAPSLPHTSGVAPQVS